jgi:nicotinamide-nucleotide amidase
MNKTNDVEILLVGDELLKGERSDTHLSYLGRVLRHCGVRVGRVQVVGDSVEEIAAVVAERCVATRMLILTGGLGPTPDDVTRHGVAKALGLCLEFHEPSWESIRRFFAERGKEATDVNRQQAEFPAGARVLANSLGTAPGFVVDHADTTVVVLPGPPPEVRQMVEYGVLPLVRDVFQREPVRVETFRTIGVGESVMRSLIGDELDVIDAYAVSSLPSRTGVDVILTEKPGLSDRSRLDEEAAQIDRVLRDSIGNKYYERGERSLFEVVHDLLTRRGETLAAAESLTGGWIGKLFTDIPGSSAHFLAGVVAYGNDAKVEYLGVNSETLETYGAVSEETCTEMAHGIRRRARADYGLATTGIAGPTGATPGKPTGLTYIGISWDGGCKVNRQVYGGTRDDVRQRACHGVVWLLYDHLND